MAAREPHCHPTVGPGTRLNGVFEIDGPIAAGGMGVVYKGRALMTGDPVAIKMLNEEMGACDSARALFRREALSLHDLQNDAIVRYFVFAVEPTLRRPYLVMEFVEGVSVSKRLSRGAFTDAEADVLRRRLAGGLGAAHKLGIVHRDVSPDNVLLPDGDVERCKIIDFGIARAVNHGTTIIGAEFAGKLNFASPEQLGLFGEVSPKSDMYSLALVLAAALRGRPLDMGGTQLEILNKRRSRPDLSDIASPMRPLLERMLQPNPRHRPASMEEVAAWEPASPAVRVRAARPSRLVPVGAALGLVAAVATVVLVRRDQAVLSSETLGAVTATASSRIEQPAPVIRPSEAPVAPTPVQANQRTVEPSPPASAQGDDLVRAAQVELKRVECYGGPVDGALNEATRDAMESFARRHALTWSGDVGENAVSWLRRSDAASCPIRASLPVPLVERDDAQPRGKSCRMLSDQAQITELSPSEAAELKAACSRDGR